MTPPPGYQYLYTTIDDSLGPYSWCIRVYRNWEGETWASETWASRSLMPHREARDLKYDSFGWYRRQLPFNSIGYTS
jgi:hypothetical protein